MPGLSVIMMISDCSALHVPDSGLAGVPAAVRKTLTKKLPVIRVTKPYCILRTPFLLHI